MNQRLDLFCALSGSSSPEGWQVTSLTG